MITRAPCKHCGALHPEDTAYGDGCPMLPETWPVQVQQQLDDDWANWPKGKVNVETAP